MAGVRGEGSTTAEWLVGRRKNYFTGWTAGSMMATALLIERHHSTTAEVPDVSLR
jgi:hypothetical protein